MLPLALPKSVAAWIVGSSCIGISEQTPYLQIMLVRDDLCLPEQTRRRSSSLMWALNMFGIACAFPCAGVLTAWHSMEAVLWFGIACQTALALTVCVVMTVEAFMQRGLPCGGDGAEGAAAEGGGEGTEDGKAKGCGLKLRTFVSFAAIFFLIGHMRGVVTVGSSFLYANELSLSAPFGGWLSVGAFTLPTKIALIMRSCHVQVPLDAFVPLLLSVPGTILYASSLLYTIAIGETIFSMCAALAQCARSYRHTCQTQAVAAI